MKELERYLQKKILPDLEKGRPDFDKPHTISVVAKLKEILQNSPEIQIDYPVLLIAAYAHDWGYVGLPFCNDQSQRYLQVLRAKKEHMRLGKKKISKLLENSFFSFLTQKQKARCVYLVAIHDKLDLLKDTDELILMEADTLGALDLDFVKPTFDFESNKRYVEGVKRRRLPKFITKFGKKEAVRLLRLREEYYEKKNEK